MSEIEIIGTHDRERTWTIGDILENGDVQAGIHSDVTKRFECYAIGLQNRFLTIDEVRKLEGLPELIKDNGGIDI